MNVQAIFGVSVLFGFIAWTVVARMYIWPALRGKPRVEALRPILVLHSFRFIGMSFLVPGVVSPELPLAFAQPAAFGDLATATLALLSLATLPGRIGIVVAWTFNVVGTVDLIHAFQQGNRVGLQPGLQGAAFYIPTFLVPLLLVTHALAFRILLRPAEAKVRS